MKLNQDCVRDILLYSENNCTLEEPVDVLNISIKDYSKDDLIYTTLKLDEAEFLNIHKITAFGNMVVHLEIKSLTYDGHSFLDNIRDDGIWKDTKTKLSTLTSYSLRIMESVASSLLTAKINGMI